MRPGLLGTPGLALVLNRCRCDPLAGKTSVDPHGAATSDRGQFSNRHHFALVYGCLARLEQHPHAAGERGDARNSCNHAA
jgi:hypothetical protein